MNELTGSCHCGNITVRFRSEKTARQLPVRACQCTFCRKHSVRTTVDSKGTLLLAVSSPRELSTYSFGMGITQFIVCRHCGIYVAAIMRPDDRCAATLNVNVLDGNPFGNRAGEPMNYAAESSEQRTSRRLRQWTPARMTTEIPRGRHHFSRESRAGG